MIFNCEISFFAAKRIELKKDKNLRTDSIFLSISLDTLYFGNEDRLYIKTSKKKFLNFRVKLRKERYRSIVTKPHIRACSELLCV